MQEQVFHQNYMVKCCTIVSMEEFGQPPHELEEVSDEQLIAAVVEGSSSHEQEAAFTELYERYLPIITRFINDRFPNLDWMQAEEIIADTLVKIWRSAATYRGDSRLSTWIFTIAHMAALEDLRKGLRNAPLDFGRAEDLNLQAADVPEKEVLNRVLVDNALGLLGSRLAPIALLYDYYGYRQGEIAKMTDTKPATVRSRYHEAKQIGLSARKIFFDE